LRLNRIDQAGCGLKCHEVQKGLRRGLRESRKFHDSVCIRTDYWLYTAALTGSPVPAIVGE
jgi:hypothetical protein